MSEWKKCVDGLPPIGSYAWVTDGRSRPCMGHVIHSGGCPGNGVCRCHGELRAIGPISSVGWWLDPVVEEPSFQPPRPPSKDEALREAVKYIARIQEANAPLDVEQAIAEILFDGKALLPRLREALEANR